MADIPNDFPWRPGMFFWDDSGSYWVIVSNAHGGFCANYDNPGDVETLDSFHTKTPDMNHPATLGALLGAVREAWRSPTAHTRQNGTIRTKDNRIVPAWDVCDLYLDDEGARAIGASRAGSVRCSLLLSESDALLAAWNARPRPT